MKTVLVERTYLVFFEPTHLLYALDYIWPKKHALLHVSNVLIIFKKVLCKLYKKLVSGILCLKLPCLSDCYLSFLTKFDNYTLRGVRIFAQCILLLTSIHLSSYYFQLHQYFWWVLLAKTRNCLDKSFEKWAK